MPKAVLSAAEILGTTPPAAGGEIPVVPEPTPAPEGEVQETPQAFETPPPAEAPAPSAESVLSAAGGAAVEPPADDEIAQIEFVAGADLARAGEPLPEGASENARKGYLSVSPVLAGASMGAGESVKTGATAPAPAARDWRFVKNIHTGEIIHLKDGTEYVFPTALHVVKDEELAKKLLEVADQHHIVLQ